MESGSDLDVPSIYICMIYSKEGTDRIDVFDFELSNFTNQVRCTDVFSPGKKSSLLIFPSM